MREIKLVRGWLTMFTLLVSTSFVFMVITLVDRNIFHSEESIAENGPSKVEFDFGIFYYSYLAIDKGQKSDLFLNTTIVQSYSQACTQLEYVTFQGDSALIDRSFFCSSSSVWHAVPYLYISSLVALFLVGAVITLNVWYVYNKQPSVNQFNRYSRVFKTVTLFLMLIQNLVKLAFIVIVNVIINKSLVKYPSHVYYGWGLVFVSGTAVLDAITIVFLVFFQKNIFFDIRQIQDMPKSLPRYQH
ncbi:hypothetical protein HDV06_006199 [Boothiomyces sp. JEL0866]|nr:hypothetical protein HDV06_006199 [Boothiomyces sp. JEL0866]